MNFFFKFGCVYKYHLSGLSTLTAVASWSPSALKSSDFVCLYTCVDVWLHECVCVCVCVWLWWCANAGGQIFWQHFKELVNKILIMMYFSSFEKKRTIPSVFFHWFIFLISHCSISCLTHSSQTLQLFHKRWGLNPLSLKLCLLVTTLINKILWTWGYVSSEAGP